jgi:hypothetical protein
LKEIKATAAIAAITVDASAEADIHASATVLENRLHAALTELVSDQVTLLVLDEVQALAGARREDFVASLRTIIQKLQGKLLVFYTGSSRDGLNSMFRQHKAPLFASAMPLQLDDLGDDFIEDRVAFVAERSHVPIMRQALSGAFERVGKTPEFLNEIILHLIIAGDGDVERAMEAWRRSHRDAGVGAIIAELKPFELALMQFLAQPSHPSVYSNEAMTQLQAALGELPAVSTTLVQGALRRLARLDLVAPTGKTGEYAIEDRAVLLELRDMKNALTP